jgi:hypothetical protein
MNYRRIERLLAHILERIDQMSQSLSDQMTAALASISTGLTSLSTDVSTVGADVTALVAGMTPGSTITAEMVATAQGIAASVNALDTTVQGIAANASAALPGGATGATGSTGATGP